jgi:SAM-dependent methyltransferase
MKKEIFAARQLTELFDYISNHGAESDMDKVAATIKNISQVEVDCADDFFAENSIEQKFPNSQKLEDSQISKLNTILPWSTVVSFGGQMQGSPWDAKKRVAVHSIPDRHITDLSDLIKGGRVLEVGCHEGVYTLGLLKEASKVVALDGRIENVAKTIMRVWLANELHRADVVCHDLELLKVPMLSEKNETGLCFELIHHNGVLYHLSDPLGHLDNILEHNPSESFFLDTHVAKNEQCNAEYENAGKKYQVFDYKEPAIRNVSPFAGITPVARWLRIEDIKAYFSEKGFNKIVKDELREERNGLRARLIVSKR